MRSHRWNLDQFKVPYKPPSPLPSYSLKQLFSHSGPKEGTKEHKDPEEKAGFNYRTILGELLYCYVSCRLYIVYGFTMLFKLSSTPSDYHYSCLNNLARYLPITRDWGIRYKIIGPWLDLPYPKYHPIVWNKNIPKPKHDIDKGELMCFVESTYGNEPTTSRSTTGFILHFTGVQLCAGLKINQ